MANCRSCDGILQVSCDVIDHNGIGFVVSLIGVALAGMRYTYGDCDYYVDVGGHKC